MNYKTSIFSALVILASIAGCTGDRETLIFKYDNIIAKDDGKASLTIAGNTYERPLIKIFPYILRVHHTSNTWIHFDGDFDNFRLVYHDRGIRQGISREIHIAKGESDYNEAATLIALLKKFRDPALEIVNQKFGDWYEPLWIRLKISEASDHQPGKDAEKTSISLDINFTKSTIRTSTQPVSDNELKEPDIRSNSTDAYREKYSLHRYEMDVFEANGRRSYETSYGIIRQLESGFSTGHTVSNFQFGDITSTLIESGNPITYYSRTKIAGLVLTNPARLFRDHVVIMHGCENKYVIYVETAPKPSEMLVIIKDNKSGATMKITGANAADNETLECLYRLTNEVCQMPGPLVSVIEVNESNSYFRIAWEGYVEKKNGSRTQLKQKYHLIFDFTENRLRIAQY